MFSFLAVSTNTYHGFSLHNALSGIALAGFRFVEMACVRDWTNHFDLENASLASTKELRGLMRSFGLEVVSLSAHSNLASPEGVTYLKKALHFAEDLGARVVNTGTVENIAQKDALLHHLEVLAHDAEKTGVQIGLEIHGDFLKSGQVASLLMEEVRSPFVGINYDTGNAIYYGDVRPEEDIKACLPHIVHLHLKDKRGGYKVWDFPPLGEGTVDFPTIFALLKESQKDVPLSVEIEFQGHFDHPREFVDEAVRKSFDYLSRIFKGEKNP
ncbi:MAG: sugar phosphate isomerase/epimerase family protein [Candidatus Caldatribacteriaceae bacterium]